MTHHADKHANFSAGDYPALRNFLRGYMNEDMKEEYGSAVAAAKAFYKGASPADRTALAAEWQRFSEQTKAMPLDQVNRLLTGPLGSSYSLAAPDFPAISAILRG